MPKIENTSERQYDCSVLGQGTVQIPPAQKDDNGTRRNGSATVTAEFLAGLKKDSWGAGLFASGDLVEAAEQKDPQKAKPAGGEQKDPQKDPPPPAK
jgi:hypothetical protein